MIKASIECHVSDVKFLEEYQEQVDRLSGLIIEILETNPSSVLSPVIRELAVEKARLVQLYQSKLTHRLAVDNPGEALRIHP